MSPPETATAALAITLFGPMQVRVQGQPLPAFRSRKALWALALLTLRHDRPVEREWLAATLWPDVEPSQAFANLRPVLSELRRALGEEGARLQALNRQTLRLELADADADVLTFDAAIQSGNLPDLEQAVGLYGGPLLEGCQEEWVPQERAAREQTCLQALLKLGADALAAGKYERAIGYYQKATVLNAWSDAARRGWMEALAKQGDRNAAMQVYREFVNVLRGDPTAVPDEKTTTLYQRLRAEARQQASTPVVTKLEGTTPRIIGYLPHSLTDLVGREDERLEVAERLRRSRLITLTGMGGIGKTRLAMEVAREVVQEHPDGVWLVALEALTEGKQVVPQIATVLGVKEEPGRTALQSVTETLRAKRLLLVLDNCEHLLEASAHTTAHLLRECAYVRILATSREALYITGETAWAVPVLAVPDLAHLPQSPATLLRILPGFESVQLFVERAQAVQKTFALDRSNAVAVGQVCARLEGIPLALELAAARVKAMTVEQIVARLDNELGLLTSGNRTAQSRQQTLRATLDWSHALLSEPERRLLRRLSVFMGGWRLEAAEAVCAGEDLASSQVLDLLLSLIDKSLVVFGGEQDRDGRYHLLEMVRQYAGESLQASGEAEQVKTRHQEWCLNFAERAEQSLKTGEQAVWLSRLETEHGNLRAALDWSLKIGVDRGAKGEKAQPLSPISLRFCNALQQFWHVRAHLAEGRAWCESALQAEGAQERTAARAKVLNGSGMLVWMQGDYASSRAYFEESLEIHREIGDRRGIATSLNSLGNVANAQGDYASSRSYYEESLEIHREIGDQQSIATSLNNLGNLVIHLSDFVAARACFVESLEIRREIGNQLDIASSFNNLGSLALYLGDYVAAQSYYEESLSIYREIGDRRGIAAALDNLGIAAHVQGDYFAAQVHYEESLAIYREIGDRRGIAAAFHNIGNVICRLGDYVAAQSYYEESLAIYREIGARRGIANALHNMGDMARHQRDYVAARVYHRESLAINQEIGYWPGVASSLDAFAVLIAAETTAPTSPMKTAEVSRESGSGIRWAAHLWGAAQSLRGQIGAPLPPSAQEEYDRDVAAACAVVGDEAFATAWKEGRSMTLEQAVVFAWAGEEMLVRNDEKPE